MEDRLEQGQSDDLTQILQQIPCGLFLMTAAYDGRRSGALTQWVQRCSETPQMIAVALRKGLEVEPLIRDARHFALCRVSEKNRLIIRRFSLCGAERMDDPFVGIETECTPQGSPVLTRAMNYVSCELQRIIDLETGYRILVAEVLHAQQYDDSEPEPLKRNGVRNGNGQPTHDAESNGAA